MKKQILALASASALAMALASCSQPSKLHGTDRSYLDESVSPKADFYQYACGGWMKANPLSDEYSRYGSFDAIGELNNQQIQDVITSIDPASEPGSNARKIYDLYNMGMDSVTLNAQGAQPLAADLATINAIEKDDIHNLKVSMPVLGAFYDFYVGPDMMNSNENAMYYAAGMLGLGDRDYYIGENEDEKRVLEAYRTYLTTIAKLAGYADEAAAALADNTIAIETEFARNSMTREESRNPYLQYNPASVADLDKSYPTLHIADYFKGLGVENLDTIIVSEPKLLATTDKIITSMPVEALRDYMSAMYIDAATPYLSDDFQDAAFEFSKVVSGVKEQKPRWKRALNVTEGSLGEAIGELYVAKYFPQSSKDKMLALVENLRTALGQHIDQLTWMSDTTKARAHEKLDAIIVKVGFPDTWRDYSGLTIDPSKPYWENIKASQAFEQDYHLSFWGKPVDKTIWHMTPQTVNAYYNPTTNEICFPAGILQKPFFDPEADDALNYGAIGVVIGHEMTHGFDDQGRNFDKDGNMTDWWTEADANAFNQLTQGLADQFDQIIVLGDTHANGKFTLGENIADQGGLRVAHTAYHNSLNGSEGETIDGFTPDQRFYLAYASVWAANIRDEEILRRTKTDPHSLGKWRVNATLRNLEPFFQAFDIQEGDEMFRPESERIIIW